MHCHLHSLSHSNILILYFPNHAHIFGCNFLTLTIPCFCFCFRFSSCLDKCLRYLLPEKPQTYTHTHININTQSILDYINEVLNETVEDDDKTNQPDGWDEEGLTFTARSSREYTYTDTQFNLCWYKYVVVCADLTMFALLFSRHSKSSPMTLTLYVLLNEITEKHCISRNASNLYWFYRYILMNLKTFVDTSP